MRKRRIIIGLISIAALAVLVVFLFDRPRDPRQPVKARIKLGKWISTTAVGYQHEGPPPWPVGNCFSFSNSERFDSTDFIHVANIDEENYRAIAAAGKIEDVDVLLFGKKTCLIVDPRIPREWRRDVPCGTCTKDGLADFLLANYPNEFREKK